MNIFAYDPDPHTCALWIDDIRRNKMITEHGQMMTAVLEYRKPNWFRNNYYVARIGYPSSVLMHPCTRWLLQSWANFRWLTQLNQCYIDMWHGPHESNRIMPAAYEAGDKFGVNDVMAPFANAARNRAMNIDFTNVPDVHKAYQLYHVARWTYDQPKPTWRMGHKPSWFKGDEHAGS